MEWGKVVGPAGGGGEREGGEWTSVQEVHNVTLVLVVACGYQGRSVNSVRNKEG
jgi:hypothetical protein